VGECVIVDFGGLAWALAGFVCVFVQSMTGCGQGRSQGGDEAGAGGEPSEGKLERGKRVVLQAGARAKVVV
jgi:hypothetical protein